MKFKPGRSEVNLKDLLVAEAIKGVIKVSETPDNFETRFVSMVNVFTSLVEARLQLDEPISVNNSDGKGVLQESFVKFKIAAKKFFEFLGEGAEDLDWKEWLPIALKEAGVKEEEVKDLVGGIDELGE